MVNSEAKTGDLLSDGTSPSNSTENTPDSGDALESPESSSSVDKRIGKDVKLKRGGKSWVFLFLLLFFVGFYVFLLTLHVFAFVLFNLRFCFEGVLQNYFAERGDFRFLSRNKVLVFVLLIFVLILHFNF